MQSFVKLSAAALLAAASGAACAQYDLARSGPVDTVSSNPNPLMYVSQNLSRNMTATYRYLDDVYGVGTSSPARLALVADPLGSGRKVFYHTVNSTDPLVSGGSRTEVSLKYDYVIPGRLAIPRQPDRGGAGQHQPENHGGAAAGRHRRQRPGLEHRTALELPQDGWHRRRSRHPRQYRRLAGAGREDRNQ